MALFLKKISALILLFIPIHMVFIIVWGEVLPKGLQKNLLYFPGGYGHMYTRLAEADTMGKADVLALGSSHAYRGVDPRMFKEAGIDLFNLGSSAQTPVQSLYLYHKYKERIDPDLVLVEVFPSIMEANGLESGLDIISNSPPDAGLFFMALKLSSARMYATFIYSLYKNSLPAFGKLEELVYRDEDTYVKGGYVEREMETFIPPDQVDPPEEVVFEEEQTEALEDLISSALEDGRKVMLIQSPITEMHNRYIRNKAEMDAYFEEIKGVKYINYNHRLRLENSLFYDSHHLNQRGVERFNRELVKDVELYLERDFKI